MTTLAWSAVNALLIDAGMSDPNKRTIALAVCDAESGRNTAVVNSLHCVGLWQINAPVWAAKLGTTESGLKDPATNVKAMMRISNNGSNWQPWSTFVNGAYKTPSRWAEAEKTSGGTGTDNPLNTSPPTGIQDPGQTIGGAVSDATGIPGALDTFTKSIRADFLLAIPVIIAVVLIILAVVILNRQNVTSVVETAAKVVK